MNDGNEIVTTLTKLFWATDHHDWEGLRRTFAGQVLLDYTATLGGEPRICAPEPWESVVLVAQAGEFPAMKQPGSAFTG